ncbi:hypothetical protein UFOVP661_13 [uncultured Caudovirales phage]|uniref:Uncharacterized protein n=1 Tax=uncultured Caudovirales phage TaxID=2100421 RepID=A0A6J5N9X3_9CAUD|nr:hypothetical protein UFOVP661_13 [uncultured Caudovirales phage]
MVDTLVFLGVIMATCIAVNLVMVTVLFTIMGLDLIKESWGRFTKD